MGRLGYTEIGTTEVGDVEAVIQRCSVKKVFLEISQNSQENVCAKKEKKSGVKKSLWRRFFHVNFGNFLRTFLQNTSGGWFWR